MSSVIFTTIPNGIVKNADGSKSYKLSVLITPKPDAGTLHPALQGWAAKLQGANGKSVKVELGTFAGGALQTTRAAQPNALLTSTVNQDAYDYLLGRAVVATDKKFDITKDNTTIKSYNVKAVNSCVDSVRHHLFRQKCRNQQQLLVPLVNVPSKNLDDLTAEHHPFNIPGTPQRGAVQPANAHAAVMAPPAPSARQLNIYNRDARRVTRDPAQLKEDARKTLQAIARRQDQAEAGMHPDNPLLDHAAFTSRIERRHSTLNPAQGYTRPFDFAERITLLSNYASLLRPLGLVFDLTIDASHANDINVPSSCVRLLIDDFVKGLLPGIALQPSHSKWCAYDNSFLPASNDGSIVGGYLTMKDHYSLIAQDPDGDGHKYAQTFASLARTKAAGIDALRRSGVDANDSAVTNFLQNLAESDLEQVLPPPSRTMGLMLVESDRAAKVSKKIQRVADLDDEKTVLFAEDLTRGLIVDLYAESPDGSIKKWYEMCRRHEELRFGDRRNNSDLIKKEDFLAQGSIKPLSTKETDKPDNESAPDGEFHAHEVVARWHGNYMCAPRPPYKAMRKSAGAEWSQPGQKFGFWPQTFEPKTGNKQLLERPPLRAGAKYAMAVRAETVAGDCVPFSDDQGFFNNNPSLQTELVTLGRWEPLQPPSVLFPPGTNADKAKMYEIVLRSNDADDKDSEQSRVLVAPRCSREVAELHVKKKNVEDLIAGFQRLELDECGKLNQITTKVDEAADVPYLPDPLAEGIAAYFIDEIVGETRPSGQPLILPLHNNVKSRAKWPDAIVHVLSVGGIRTEESRKKCVPQVSFTPDSVAEVFPGMDSDSQRFKLELPPGWKGRIRLQSAFADNDNANAVPLENMALWQTTSNRGEFDQKQLGRGDHPMLSLPRYIEVVNAVRKPLRPVDLDGEKSFLTGSFNTTRNMLPLFISRDAGSGVAKIALTYTFDRKSTGKLHSVMSWAECVDNGKAKLMLQRGSSLLLESSIGSNQDRHDPAVENNIDKFPVSDTPASPRFLQHDFEDTHYRKLTITTTGISRHKEYFSKATDDSCSSKPTVIEVELKSSSRPKAPDVFHIVPTFGWVPSKDEKNHGFQSRRLGAGLRVFLRPRWGSSGDDELLGVVVADSNIQEIIKTSSAIPMSNQSPNDNDKTPLYTSSWGADPIRFPNSPGECSNPVKTCKTGIALTGWRQIPSRANDSHDEHRSAPCDNASLLARGGACGWSLQLSEPGTVSKVSVVGYPVQSDPVRGMLFSDITFDQAPQYGTFVKLALARYQPHSIADAELSPVVLADFALLNPDRAVNIQRVKAAKPNQKETNALQVQIIGVPNLSKQDGNLRSANVFEVTLERHVYNDQNDLGWQALSDDDLKRQLIPQPQTCPMPDAPKSDQNSVPNSCEKILWSGVLFPDPLCAERRIVVREYERYSDDCNTQGGTRRLVYVDALTLEQR